MMKSTLLNLGGGDSPIAGAMNIDISPEDHIDKIVDLREIPWPWNNDEIDGIYMIHCLEHFPDRISIFKECWRILKPGGFLYVQVPHASSLYALTDLGHYTSFCINTFSQLEGTGYFKDSLFRTEFSRIFWLFQEHNRKHPYVPFELDDSTVCHPKWRRYFGFVSRGIQFLIDANPVLFERIWHGWVGGADEVVWKGIKITP